MPNWCNNSITITGPIDVIRPLYEQACDDANDETGLLDAMCPMPKALHETESPSRSSEEAQAELIAQYGASDWYSWRVNNWGTKWEISSEGLEFEDNGDGTATLSGWFDSAWAPPIGAYNHYLDRMEGAVTLEASYYEPGMDFAGFYTDGDDEYLEDLHSEYKLPKDQQSDLFKRLDEEYDLSSQFEQWDEDEEMVLDDEA